jgi:outer membrane receptor protein involved in Fe transport
MKQLFLVLLIVLIASFKMVGQCQISGNIINSGNEPVAYANMVLENVVNQSRLGAMTDDKGYFCLNNIPKGEYRLMISVIGHEPTSANIIVTGEELTINLADFKVNVTNTKLSEVIVVGSSHISEIKPASIKYKTSSLISESGGTAGDILKNMPSVAMGGSPGHNRDIRFRGLGNAYTKVLINGRETGLSGNNRETVLDQIPASAISYIEIMAVPGPEYQAEGINGVVNIVLKENASYGTHGKVEAMAGNYDGLGGGIALSNKTQKLNLFANYDFLERNLPKTKDKLKTDLKDGAVTQVEESVEVEKKRFTNHSLRTGFDYFVLPKTKLLGEYVFGYQLEDKSKTLDFKRVDGTGVFKSAGQEVRSEYKPNEYHHYFVGLDHTFKSDAKFQVNAGYQTEEQEKVDIKATYAINKIGKWANFQPALENKAENQSGEKFYWNGVFSQVRWAGGKINVGYSGENDTRSFNNTTEKFNYKDTSWVVSSNGFDNFKVTETTHALFVSDEYNIGALKTKAGVRYETTRTESNSQTSGLSGDKSYSIILPSASATFNISETQYLSFNFGRRIRRPGFKDLNPFTEQKEPTKLSKGNPALKPELAWAYEMGYLKSFKRFNVGANVFYREISDVIQKTITEDDNNIITEQPENAGTAYVVGYELMTTLKPVEFWQLSASYSQFKSEITSGDYKGDALNDQYKWTAKVITDFTLPHRFTLQMAGNIVGPKIANNKTENTIWFSDLGVEKKILANGTLMFRVTDVFNSLEKSKSERTDKSITDETEYSEGQLFMIGFNWKF